MSSSSGGWAPDGARETRGQKDETGRPGRETGDRVVLTGLRVTLNKRRISGRRREHG